MASHGTARVLVIDDLRTMKFEATYARTLGEGQRLIASGPWDEVWLDHDLGSIRVGDERESQTIRPLVRELELMAHEGKVLPIGKVYVHTMNGLGRAEIVAALSRFYNVRVVDPHPYVKSEM